MAKDEMTWHQAIDKVLSETKTPLHYTEITERILAQKLRKSFGATPAATVNAQISNSIKNDGDSSPYIRVAKGTFGLKKQTPAKDVQPPHLAPDVPESEEGEEQYKIVTSFGMYWRRSAVDWTSTTKLLGIYPNADKPVDFYKQLGIYLLYDGREVIYVGRTTEQPLGKRLYQHTSGRFAERWDRFSWFGLLPITAEGGIGTLPQAYDAATLIPALEAILIESLEPRQNRKRGDDLEAVEYIQRIDPELEKKRLKADLINKL